MGERPAYTRLDELLVERGVYPTRSRARAEVMAGNVYVDGRKVEKAGTRVSPEASLETRGPRFPYVSRGGAKLEGALDAFKLEVGGRTVLDVGASTGGFTDCCLQRGARRVYAVDVGYGQLAWTLRKDPRVVVKERSNARYLRPGDLPEPVEIAVIDVSFISLGLVLPAVRPLLAPDGQVLALVKPQFEAGRSQVGKRGVVRSPEVHREVLVRVAAAAEEAGFSIAGVTPSPLKGPEGNLEFFIRLVPGSAVVPQAPRGDRLTGDVLTEVIRRAVEAGHGLGIKGDSAEDELG
ncbi:MAG: TlyA family RNA methyltransferase [Firmicutes bacterium]|nr:TlyA family RNA methyltransferase [Bacillota bacterium]